MAADAPEGPGGGAVGGNGGEGGSAGGVGLGAVVEMQIERELKDSYLTYAMSTIMDRALPDARDGLKPSQRRLLYGMHELRVFPGRKHLKCARIVGEVMGKYHPHGDLALYGTLVGMGQTWRARATFVDPQGNFGSIVPDPPAAMRYTEARLTPAAMDMLEDLSLGTVDMVPTYDEQHEEPAVLPGKFPNLLVNGGVGIAVGMATSMAPNNPVEVLDAIIRTVENPGITLAELMQDVVEEGADGSKRVRLRGIKGPDFPTGGIIMGRLGIVEAYETGRGRVTVRARTHTEPVPGTKDRVQIVVDELPYNVAIDSLSAQLKSAYEEDKIPDLDRVDNESNARNPVRLTIALKKGADAGVVEKQLFEFTSLQTTFSMINIALVNRQPRTLSLREMIRCYIDHRGEVIRRRTAHLLADARTRAHLLEGLIFAVGEIDEVIRLIRGSATRAEAIEKLMARRFRIAAGHPAAGQIPERLLSRLRAVGPGGVEGTALTRPQAEKIGEMRLIQLVGLEIEKLATEYREVSEEIEGYERILSTPQLVLDMIKADCEAMKARHDSPRLTEVQEAEGEDLDIAALIPESECVVTISHQGYAKRVPADTYRAQGRGGKGIIAGTAKDDDFIEHVFVAGTHDHLLCFTDSGRVFKVRVFELPEMSRQSKGRPLVNLLEFKTVGSGGAAATEAGVATEGSSVSARREKPIAFLAVRNFEEGSQYLTFVSRNGVIKRTPLKDYRNVHKGGLIAVDIREGDALLDVVLTSGTDDILLVAGSGQAIRFPEDEARVMGRQAGGVRGMDLEAGDEIVGVVTIPMRADPEMPEDPNGRLTIDPSLSLLTITRNGYGKRTPVDEYRVQPEVGKPRSQSRGGKGRVDIKTSSRNGPSVAALGVRDEDDVMVGTREGQLVRVPARTISTYGRGTQGVRIVRLNEGDAVTAAARVERDGVGEAEGAAAEREGPSAG